MIGARFYTVRRRTGRHVQGVWTPGGEEEFKILGALQAASPLAASLRDDGVRLGAAAVLLVPHRQPELFPGDPGGRHAADLVFDGARWYVVTSRSDNARAGGVLHRSYQLTEIQPETERIT